MFDNGARFPLPPRKPSAPPPSNVFGSRSLPDIPSESKPPQVVDHAWMEKIDPPPFVGRHVALDNTPALARFRDFHENVVEEDQIELDEEEAKARRLMNQQVIDKIQDILNLAMEDHKKRADIEGVIKTTASQGWDPDGDPRIAFLANQVGLAPDLYVFSGRNERDCRAHASQIHKQMVGKQPPQFVVRRIGSKMDLGALQRIYRLPVRETVRYSLADFQPWLNRLASLGGATRQVVASQSQKSSLPLHEVFRRLKHDVATMTLRTASRDRRGVEFEDRPDPFIPQKQTVASGPLPEPKRFSFLHNMVLAALGKRDYQTLRRLASASHPLSSKYGGPLAYRQAMVKVLSEVPGVRLYAEDIGGFTDRPNVATVAKKLHLTRGEISSLRRALANNVVYVPRGVQASDCDGCDYDEVGGEIPTRLSGVGRRASWSSPENNGGRDFDAIGKTMGIVDRGVEHDNTASGDPGNPDHDLTLSNHQDESDDIPAAKQASEHDRDGTGPHGQGAGPGHGLGPGGNPECVGAEDEPCWEDYEMVGMKDKDGKQVPNCVPKQSSDRGAMLLESFGRGFGRQSGLPPALAKEKGAAGPTKKNVNPLMKDRGFLDNMGLNVSDESLPTLKKDVDLSNFDTHEPGGTFFGSGEV